MSLFPAYSEANENVTENVPTEPWLQNSSFQIHVPQKSQVNENDNSSNSVDEVEEEAKPLKVRKKSKKKCRKAEVLSTENGVFFIDKKSTREFLTVKTISRPAVARYKICYYMVSKKRRNRRFKRYFQQISLQEVSTNDIDTQAKISDDKPLQSMSNETSGLVDSVKHEDELTQATAFYNKTVYDEPNNVHMWLKFIDFQDTIFNFEKSFKKGSIAKGLRVNTERKLNILEKAQFHNPNSEDLHRKRLYLMFSVYPADELQKQLKDLVQKDQGNIILWQGYIEATQCSMSHCNFPSVLQLYTNCLSTLHKIRRNAMSDNKILEECILKMLYQCGLFLKQSGHFEQLWTLLKMYLEMNLGQLVKNSFDISTNANENQLLELEDMVFKSQLPSHELWLRIEKLRESCHWLPVTEQCEDPQRIVFVEDVVKLIQPITVPENTFRLTATILTLLKIPLLPWRHNTMQQLGLDYVPWALDSIESILPIYYPIYPMNSEFKNFFIDYQLAVGPQYLKVLPGQEEYLSFILNIMQKCIDCLQGEDKTSLIVWWFRFQRLLIILDSNEKFNMPPSVKKSIKSNIKNLLKKPEHRSNTLFYVEYALIEKELNSADSCIQILKIASSSVKGLHVDLSNINEEQRYTCYLVRTLVETVIHMEKLDEAVKYLVNFVLGKPIQTEYDQNENILMQAYLKFKHITLQLLSSIQFKDLPPVEHFLPIFFCDWVICNGWLIYLTKGPLECGTFMEEILEKLNEKGLHMEIIFEFYVAIMFKFCASNPGYGLFKALDDVLYRALEWFPNNSFFLSILAKEQFLLNSLGPKWWKTKNLLLRTGHALPVLLLIFITSQIIINLQEQLVDTITGSKISMENSSFKYAMLSLFEKATKANICTRRCGLVWRLYLQFVHKYCDPKLCRKVYYCAVEECPWLKALYIDAAIYIPAELGQIQDLLIEKQLRIHITPEELDVLKD